MAEDGRPLAPVAEVREELRRLGYFDSGLDRFVLGGARAGGALAASWHAALRIGVAGGFVFGVALSLLAASLEPETLQKPSDLALLFLYLAIPVGIATTLSTLGLGLVASSLARTKAAGLRSGLPRVTALLLAGSGLAYLGLWWRSHGGEAPALQQAAFVAIGAAIAFLLGRFGAIATVAVLSAGGLVDRVPEAALSRRRLLPLLLGATLVFGSSLAMANYLEARAEQPPDFAVVPTGLRVRVIAIDGLEQRMTAQMAARGEMPHLAGLLAKGARATLKPEPEQVPAIVWTTIATGRGPEAHGIRAAGPRRLPGMAAPVPLAASGWSAGLARVAELARLTRTEAPTAVLRSAKTFWNVASDKGLRVGIVNWWASWPADPVNGFVVSDRTFLKLEKGGAPDREVAPAEAMERLRLLLAGREHEDRARRLDRFHVGALLVLREGAPPDLEAVYLNGLDVFTMQRLEQAAADVASLDERLEDVRSYHRLLDERIGELAAGLGPGDVLVLVADPGRFARRSGPGAFGLLLLAGGPVRAGEMGAVTERDVAPTVLHLLGLPVSNELDGSVLLAAFDDAFQKAHPVRPVASYGRRPRARPLGSSFDRDVIEELRSLGYIR